MNDFQRVLAAAFRLSEQDRRRLIDALRQSLMAEAANATTPNFIDQLLAQPVSVTGSCPLSREDAHAR